jgi:decaprenylphospho-beta-D-ribofuranose 2-oxidase
MAAGNALRRSLTGWGRTSPSQASVVAVHGAEEVAPALLDAGARGLIPRGLGRSYGDVAQNGGGVVLDMTGMNRILQLDAERGRVTLEAGCSIADLIDACLPQGWFVPVTPGTAHVTIGGAIATDVHGKNHHRDGSISRHVVEIVLVDPTGEIHRLGPDSEHDLFWATVGGLGLTGVIVEATLELIPVETSVMRVDMERTRDLDETFERLAATDHLYRYSVAWIDCRRRGRSVLIQGDHARVSDANGHRGHRPQPAGGTARRIPPGISFGPLLRSRAVSAFNELHFRRARDVQGGLEPLAPFFFPLDAIADWNRLYGGGGFLQYQFVVPFDRDDVVRTTISTLSSAGASQTLAVLKRLGTADGMLSFPMPGWTLAVDIALPMRGLGRVLDELDEVVAEAGGRVYFAKDSRLRPELVDRMYPRLAEWRRVQATVDPEGRMQCDLARRLRLTERLA